jgi:hypothetical protein
MIIITAPIKSKGLFGYFSGVRRSLTGGEHGPKNMKIIAVPGIHHTQNLDRVEEAIAQDAANLTIFLGD